MVFLILAAFIGFGTISMADSSNTDLQRTISGSKAEIKNSDINYNSFYGPIREKFKIEDAVLSELKNHPPKSAWIESEKEFYQSLLKGQTYDVLIVPFQTLANGVDIIGRMLMSYRLASAIEQNTNLKVVPLKLLYPALGKVARFQDEQEVISLAEILGVSRIIWGYAGTRDFPDRAHIQFSFTIVDQKDVSKVGEYTMTQKSWPYQNLAQEMIPIQLFEDNMADILNFLGIPNQASKAQASLENSDSFPVPESPRSVIEGKSISPVYQSYLLQMLAMLAPTDYHKNYLFTYSLINMFSVPKNNPDRALIEARAYIHLYRRPAAIESLDGIESEAGKALLEYINANLPELEEKVEAIKPSIKRFLAELELFSLKNDYKKPLSDDEREAFISKYPRWHYFLKIRLSHYNRWERASNAELKLILDDLFPIQGFAARDLAAGYQIAESASEDQLYVELLFRKHIRLAASGLGAEMTGGKHTKLLGAGDFLIMLDSIGIFNLLQEIGFYLYTQGLPNEALRLCDEILRTYDGHPYFTIYKGVALNRSLKTRRQEEKKAVVNQGFNLVLNSIWWNGCQNWVHARSRKYTWKPPLKGNHFIDAGNLMKAIDSDYPFRTNIVSYSRRPESMLLPWAHTKIHYHKNVFERESLLPSAIMGRSSKAEVVLSDMKTRFNGNPKKAKILASIKLTKIQPITTKGSPLRKAAAEERKKLFLKEVEANSQDWSLYKQLAQIYIEEENYQAAKDVMLKYPQIKNPDKFKSVGVSNIAGAAGELLFWKGKAELSRPFFQLSAQLNTGSSRSLKSKENLAVLDSDFETAKEYAIRRAKRYNSSNAYSQFMKYLHLTGEHETAWSIFTTLLSRFDDPVIWYSASTGHRIQGTKPEQLIAWMHQIGRLSPSEKQKGHIAQFGIWCLTDHAPSSDLVKTIEALDAPLTIKFPMFRNRAKLSRNSVGANSQEHKNSALFYSIFAKGYNLIIKKKYEAAYDELSRAMDQHGWDYGAAGSTLKSYVAWAGVKSGNADRINRVLIHRYNHTVFSRGNDYDVELLYAAYEGGTGNHGKAVQHLKKAFVCRRKNEARLFSTWYQLVELCEWLYADSGDQRYRELALKWVRSYQNIQPMHAWAYAVEVNLTDNHEDKIRALAFAQLLGSQLNRISYINKELKGKAEQWLKQNNPFSLKKGRAPKTDHI